MPEFREGVKGEGKWVSLYTGKMRNPVVMENVLHLDYQCQYPRRGIIPELCKMLPLGETG